MDKTMLSVYFKLLLLLKVVLSATISPQFIAEEVEKYFAKENIDNPSPREKTVARKLIYEREEQRERSIKAEADAVRANEQKKDEQRDRAVKAEAEKDSFKETAFAELGMSILKAFVDQAKQYINSKKRFNESMVTENNAIWVFLEKYPTDPFVLRFRKMFPKNWNSKFIANLCLNSFKKLKDISLSSKIRMRANASDFVSLCGSCLSPSEKKCVINVANMVDPHIPLTDFA